MTVIEDVFKNKMEKAFELSTIFSDIISFKEALSLNENEIQFLYTKINEIDEFEKILIDEIDGHLEEK